MDHGGDLRPYVRVQVPKRRGGSISTLTLAASLAIGGATAACLAYAGYVLQRRSVEADARHAALAYSIWWYGASLVIVNQTLRTFLAVAGVQDIALYTALAHAGNVPLASALGALLYYILYLMTGRRGLLGPVTVLYTLYLGYLVWYATRVGPRRLVIGDWQAQLVGTVTPTPAESAIFGLLLALPILLTVGAYTLFAFRVHGRDQRYRLVLVSGGFLILFGTILAGFLLGWSSRPWFPLAYQLPALLLSVLAVAAYRPPGWVRRWLGVEPVPTRPGQP